MSRHTRLRRTTAFRLAFLYLTIFSVLIFGLLAYISFNTTGLLTRQVDHALAAESSDLSAIYRAEGLAGLAEAIDLRARRPGASLYLLVEAGGGTLLGNIAELPLAMLNEANGEARLLNYRRLDDRDFIPYQALVRVFDLPGGFRLVIGRDVSERAEFQQVIREAFQGALAVMVVMALLSWLFVGQTVVRRLEGMAASMSDIMTGHLAQRFTVTGSGNEFDLLASGLNQMLDRIEALMVGLKAVSDNIAHDLRTPLTRLSNHLQAMLIGNLDKKALEGEAAAALAQTEKLIGLFDALLKLARIEAGAPGEDQYPFDAADLLEEVYELYAPVIEEEGGKLTLSCVRPLPFTGSRALLTQALTNLLDNALKYGRPPQATGRIFTVALSGQQEKEFLHLTVADNGPGIAPEDRARALERFVRLDASRHQDGSGLGLALATAVAHLHGGTLMLEDAAPGLCARLTLPTTPLVLKPSE